MKTILIKFSSFTAVTACTAALAGAAVQVAKPALHYAFLHKGQEQLTIN